MSEFSARAQGINSLRREDHEVGVGEAIPVQEGQELSFPPFVFVHVSVTSDLRRLHRHLSRREPG